MRKSIAGFSSNYFYNDLLQTAEHLLDTDVHLSFVDTAGSGFHETHGPDGTSLQNEGELKIIRAVLTENGNQPKNTAVISPYSGQVAAAKETLPELRVSTIDSFQGQEMDTVIVSLVRSNENGEIGFLKDYRRMNVAITRAKEQLIVIGDSSTIGSDKFYAQFLEYVEANGNYKTAWEYDVF